MRKTIYQKPIAENIHFKNEDIIVTSGDDEKKPEVWICPYNPGEHDSTWGGEGIWTCPGGSR